MTEPAEPGFIDRLRARFGWFDHVMRPGAHQRQGTSTPPASTYFTIFALFLLLDGRLRPHRVRAGQPTAAAGRGIE